MHAKNGASYVYSISRQLFTSQIRTTTTTDMDVL
jgi:hypothetical protein